MRATDTVIEPLVVDAKGLARMLGVCLRTIRTRHSAGELPLPSKFVRRILWSVEEIKEWMNAGMPDRDAWNKIRAAKRR